jgi:uncharacterized membrane protein YgdD (TMEM256/DUF423 family)
VRPAWLGLGALLAALAVAAGAFGAHALNERLDPPALELWETASRYLMYGGLALMAAAAADRSASRPVPAFAGWALGGGAALFSGTVFGLALGGPRWLGAVTPLGGLLLIVGLGLVAWWGLAGAAPRPGAR